MEQLHNMMKAEDASYKKTSRKNYQHMKEGSIFKEILKQIKKGDRAAVLNYNNYIKSLLSIHKESREPFNWDDVSTAPEPKLPLRLSLNQDIAEQEYRAYAPSVLDKMLGQCKKKMNDLMKNTEQAKRYDDLIYNASLREFRNEYQDWEKIQCIAKGIKIKEVSAYQEAIDFFNPFEEIIQQGARPECEFYSDHVIANLNLHWAEIIPDYIVSQTASGKVLNSEMPDYRFNEICHHHVCACALRLGRDIFALLPVGIVLVNAYACLPDKKSGGTQKQVILSIKFNRTALTQLHIGSRSGPEYLADFSHHIDFSADHGFSPIQPLNS
jgi:hypothetical protein